MAVAGIAPRHHHNGCTVDLRIARRYPFNGEMAYNPPLTLITTLSFITASREAFCTMPKEWWRILPKRFISIKPGKIGLIIRKKMPVISLIYGRYCRLPYPTPGQIHCVPARRFTWRDMVGNV